MDRYGKLFFFSCPTFLITFFLMTAGTDTQEKNQFVVSSECIPKKRIEKKSKAKLTEEAVRACQNVLRESAKVIAEISQLNSAALDCVSNILDGSCDELNKSQLNGIIEKMNNVHNYLKEERKRVCADTKKIDSLIA